MSSAGQATRVGAAALPGGCSWRSLHAVSWLGGIGFTMSLFVTQLAFDSEALTTEAKVGIFTASVLAATMGALLLRRQEPCEVPEVPEEDAAQSAQAPATVQ